MTATTIDTLELARELQKGGVDEKAAETIAQAIGRNIALPNTLATKADFTEFKAEANGRFTRIETNQFWQKWALGIVIAVMLALMWQMVGLSREVTAMSKDLAVVSKDLGALSDQVGELTAAVNRLAK